MNSGSTVYRLDRSAAENKNSLWNITQCRPEAYFACYSQFSSGSPREKKSVKEFVVIHPVGCCFNNFKANINLLLLQ